MAQQGTEEKSGSTEDEGSGQGSSAEQNTGRHAATDEATGPAADETQAPSEESSEESGSAEQKTEESGSTEQKTEESGSAEQKTEKSGSSEQKTEKSGSSEQKTEKDAAADAPAERQERPARGQGDTSWAEPEREPVGSSRRRSIDVGELAWRTGNVLATVVRALALLFALVLVVNVVLVLVGVNPTNGVAQFVGAVTDIVILGFRDLFVPTNPLLMLIVNSLIAAIFWAFVGELLSRLIRFLAARLS